MDNSVSDRSFVADAYGLSLRSRKGRKYLTRAEGIRVSKASEALEERKRLFVMALLYSGGRISEVLGVCPCDFDIEGESVIIHTLKRRKPHQREVPLPKAFVAALDRCFDLGHAQRDTERRARPIFGWSRVTGWRIVKLVCELARIEGIAASPKGMRHFFGYANAASGVPVGMTQKWLGHAKLSTTLIYQDALGDEEKEFAGKFWDWAEREAA